MSYIMKLDKGRVVSSTEEEVCIVEIYDLLLGAMAIIVIAGFSTLATQAEKAMWRKCRRRQCCLRLQQQITLGKSHCR
jgi:Flp pilus assembly pilin Flp